METHESVGSRPLKQESRTMRDQIQARLEVLGIELQRGQSELHKLDAQRVYLHETVLRISGAVQVLEELIEDHLAGQDGVLPSELGPAYEPAGSTLGGP